MIGLLTDGQIEKWVIGSLATVGYQGEKEINDFNENILQTGPMAD